LFFAASLDRSRFLSKKFSARLWVCQSGGWMSGRGPPAPSFFAPSFRDLVNGEAPQGGVTFNSIEAHTPFREAQNGDAFFGHPSVDRADSNLVTPRKVAPRKY
jgi:hypothetical protein